MDTPDIDKVWERSLTMRADQAADELYDFARRLERERDAYKRDALRYKWLRHQMIAERNGGDNLSTGGQTPAGFDAAIDAAMKEAKP